MKKFILLLLLIFNHFVLFAAPNYNNGNGTILFESVEGNKKTVVRKCEMEVTIGEKLGKKSRIIYDDYNTCVEIGKIEPGDRVKILEICTIKFSEKPSDRWGDPYGERWYKIQINGITGWIHISISSIENIYDPYYDNRFEILETLNVNGKLVNVRKNNQKVTLWENLNIRNLPDVNNTLVLHTVRPRETPEQDNVEVIAMTDERVTIDNRSDYWLKIKYKEYEGWIFGGYASVERGGAKYYLPHVLIWEELCE